MVFNIKTYMMEYLAPLFYSLYGSRQEVKTKGSELERHTTEMPRMISSSPKKVQYKQRTVSTTGGTRGRRG